MKAFLRQQRTEAASDAASLLQHRFDGKGDLMRKLISFILIILLLFPAAVCASTVVTSFYPVWLLTLNLTAGLDQVTVRNLAAPETGCLHDYTLMPSDMLALDDADALLINGAGMEAFLPMILESFPNLPVIDASSGIQLLGDNEESHHDEEHEPEETVRDEHEDHEHGAHDHEGNSHIWLDPHRASMMAENLANGLCNLMPEHRKTISANLSLLQSHLTELELTMKSSVAGLPSRDAIIMHEAFPYFAEACNLHIIEAVDKEPEDNLPASRLAGLIRTIGSGSPKPVIISSTEPDPAAEILSAETGAAVCQLDTLASGPSDPAPDYYEQVMRTNLQKIMDALCH